MPLAIIRPVASSSFLTLRYFHKAGPFTGGNWKKSPMNITMGSPPKRSGELLSRDFTILSWLLILLSMLRSIILISSMMIIVFLNQSLLTRELTDGFRVWLRLIPKDVW